MTTIVSLLFDPLLSEEESEPLTPPAPLLLRFF